jgi:hypothetical protein
MNVRESRVNKKKKIGATYNYVETIHPKSGLARIDMARIDMARRAARSFVWKTREDQEMFYIS